MTFKEEIQEALETGNASDELLLYVENLRDSYLRKEKIQDRCMNKGWQCPPEAEFTRNEEIAFQYYNELILEKV